MEWAGFHHPDLSLPVIRRKASEEWLDLLLELGTVIATRGWSSAWGRTYPSETAYRSAVYRLRRKGLIAHRGRHGNAPVLALTPAGEAQRPTALRPQRHWNRTWNKIWYVMVYDVPEQDRRYRAALRGFLRRMRMGCLQGSVWVTPHDIRPEFDDLVKAAGLDSYAFLFEARTVLGQKPEAIVDTAWDFDALRELHADYCQASERNLRRLRATVTCSADALVECARIDVSAYLRAMRDDPLLPRALWPSHYLGPEMLQLHREISAEIRTRLSSRPSSTAPRPGDA